MDRTPISDVLEFLTTPSWTTAVYWLLLVGSAVIAWQAWSRLAEQRHAAALGDWLLRLFVGSMWWQQSLWKLPPYYTDNPTAPFGTTGLAYWMGQIVKYAPFKFHAAFVQDVILAHFYFFAPIVYLAEVGIGVSLMLGLLTRLGGLAGFLMAVNLWAGLYIAPGEWPWTYFFLIVIQGVYTLHPPGRSLGVDALLRGRAGGAGIGRLVLAAS